MIEAIKFALRYDPSPNPRVGAVLVDKNNKIKKITAHKEKHKDHAEYNLFKNSDISENDTLYVTLEPCLMCAGASYWAQLNKIVFGASDEKRGFQNMAGLVLHPKTECVKGVIAEECAQLLTDFFASKRELK